MTTLRGKDCAILRSNTACWHHTQRAIAGRREGRWSSREITVFTTELI